MAAGKRSQLVMAKAATMLLTIPEEPSTSDPTFPHHRQDTNLPPTNQDALHTIPPARPDEDQFYYTEVDEGDLELSGTQLSCFKEALEDPPEDEGQSKRDNTATPTPIETSEGNM
jgi:hypothetical protein